MLSQMLCAACALLLVAPHHAALQQGAARDSTQDISERPDWTKYPAMARWLVHKSDWGTLSTISRQLSSWHQPVPFGNAVSFSDGPTDQSTGRLLFYLTVRSSDVSWQRLESSCA